MNLRDLLSSVSRDASTPIGSRREGAEDRYRSTNSPLVKLCGMTRLQDVHALNACHPDLCGFIVDVPSSIRSVSSDRVRELAAALDDSIAAVGVFVDAPCETISSLVEEGTLDAVQLHGHEDDAFIADLRSRVDVVIIQAFHIKGPIDVERARVSTADLVLVDGSGGAGLVFDWSLLGALNRPFLLAGGLGPDNVVEAISTVRPWGVDMSSGIETAGVKDAEKMRAAVAAVRSVRP